MYEVREPKYLTPDVASRFDTINISQQGPDRVEIKGVQGEPPPVTTKVCINNLGGHKNATTLLLAGTDIEKKARILEDTLFTNLGGKEQFEAVDFELIRSDKENPPSNEEAFAYVRIAVTDPDPKKVASFSSKFVELALCSVPGMAMTSPPGKGSPVIRHWPTLISQSAITQKVFVEGKAFDIAAIVSDGTVPPSEPVKVDIPAVPSGATTVAPLGNLYAARSGDKGGNANLGIWGKTPESYAFLSSFLTVDKLKEVLPDMAGFEIERYELPNLLALNFYVKGLLGDGVSASTRMDPQAKALGEYLRTKTVEIPSSLL
jgi:acyclic terpene utilization AtuA family protein